MTEGQRLRLRLVGALLAIATLLIVYRLVSLQFYVNTAYFIEAAQTEYRYQVTIKPPRGQIYDRNGVLLVTNNVEYEIGLSPRLILDRETAAQQLSAAMGQRVIDLELTGVVVNPLTQRYYPHGPLASHMMGFVNEENQGYGIEMYYNDILAGDIGIEDQSRIPFDAGTTGAWRPGSNLYLTL